MDTRPERPISCGIGTMDGISTPEQEAKSATASDAAKKGRLPMTYRMNVVRTFIRPEGLMVKPLDDAGIRTVSPQRREVT